MRSIYFYLTVDSIQFRYKIYKKWHFEKYNVLFQTIAGFQECIIFL